MKKKGCHRQRARIPRPFQETAGRTETVRRWAQRACGSRSESWFLTGIAKAISQGRLSTRRRCEFQAHREVSKGLMSNLQRSAVVGPCMSIAWESSMESRWRYSVTAAAPQQRTHNDPLHTLRFLFKRKRKTAEWQIRGKITTHACRPCCNM